MEPPVLCALLITAIALRQAECVVRIYYIAITEEVWNYAPSKQNLINNRSIDQDKHASVYLSSGPTRIGSVYKKAVYRQYTDDSYTTEIPKPAWLGFLGPILRAEVNDVMVVHLKNFASRPYSLHPHGVFYEKDSEGALYPDGTSGRDKSDDAVPPNETHTYNWTVKQEYAPTEGDASCLTWIYHSHGDAPKDIASGLIGALLTCKKGILDNSGQKRSDVDEDFILMFSVVDENLSWYLEENAERFCSDSTATKELIENVDEDFRESNYMHSINGYVYGNLPAPKLCVGHTVSWHLFGIGNEVDIHSAYFHGHTVLDRGHRTDVLSLFPASFVTATMTPRTKGKWLLSCQVNDHVRAGMQGFYEVSGCGSTASPTEVPGIKRHFYIAAEEVYWDYAPSKMNYMENTTLTKPDSDSEVYFSHDGGKLGGKYLKARYISYTDGTFTNKTHIAGSDVHLGILGPVIRAETGDVIVVTFFNNAMRDYSIQPHGLQYEKAYEGAMYQDGTQKDGASVAPGEKFTYHWRVTEGPSDSDPPCLSYLYYSAVDPVRDTNSGLIGPVQVCKKGVLDGSGHQRADNIQHEFFLLFSVMDENESWYLEDNIKKFGSKESDTSDEEFQESNKMHAVNGYMYGNLLGLELCNGEHVVWHTLGLGTEVDIHGIYFQGNTFQRDGMNRDTLNLFPHTTVTVSMTPDNNGIFELSCHTGDHYTAGMRQHYKVKFCSAKTPALEHFTSNERYYIAAEEVEWNYAPDRKWELEKHMTTLEDSPGSIYLNQSSNRIGAKYKKVVFREYTDGTFTEKKPRRVEEEHLGIMGPILRAEVGEKIQVVFKNNARRPYSVHAHGVKTNDSNQIYVQPGHVLTYNWTIPERSGPGPNDPNCITFAYYSSASFVEDLMSGLVGPLIVCRKNTLNADRRRKDIDKEFALLFMVFDENNSHYLDENIRTYLKTDPDQFKKYDEDFMESNKMHGINGKLYGNLHGLNMTEKDKTEWYLLGLGSEVDMHTVHFHAQSFIYKTDQSHRADVYDLFPGTFQTIELIAGSPGQWLLHCHVTDHIYAGMETLFTVHPKVGVEEKRPSLDLEDNNFESTGENAFSHFTSLSTAMLYFFGLVLLSLVTH
ncbi:hephaestin-like protein 1a isoform X2 [Myxocyprinus asiaticus]|uniref:hephaestin-like protein 1a isoform X2 n=1 Tax=Myxocyprinus asiaticus TaxID=70543 RepID=UPI00222329E9|nr:hephaestin-like protein 1a isoform X2 [Myxocyprinus asiaticus]